MIPLTFYLKRQTLKCRRERENFTQINGLHPISVFRWRHCWRRSHEEQPGTPPSQKFDFIHKSHPQRRREIACLGLFSSEKASEGLLETSLNADGVESHYVAQSTFTL